MDYLYVFERITREFDVWVMVRAECDRGMWASDHICHVRPINTCPNHSEIGAIGSAQSVYLASRELHPWKLVVDDGSHFIELAVPSPHIPTTSSPITTHRSNYPVTAISSPCSV